MRYPPGLLEFIGEASENTLGALELARLNQVSNLRKEFASLLEEWVRSEAEACLVRYLLLQRSQPSLAPVELRAGGIDSAKIPAAMTLQAGSPFNDHPIVKETLDSAIPWVTIIPSQAPYEVPIQAAAIPSIAMIGLSRAQDARPICGAIAQHIILYGGGYWETLSALYAECCIPRSTPDENPSRRRFQIDSNSWRCEPLVAPRQENRVLTPLVTHLRPEFVLETRRRFPFTTPTCWQRVNRSCLQRPSFAFAGLAKDKQSARDPRLAVGGSMKKLKSERTLSFLAEPVRAGPRFSTALAA